MLDFKQMRVEVERGDIAYILELMEELRKAPQADGHSTGDFFLCTLIRKLAQGHPESAAIEAILVAWGDLVRWYE